MRNIKDLNIDESIKLEKLIYTENWLDKIDQIILYLFFSWGFILPFLIYFNPHRDFEKTGVEYYLLFVFSVFCGFVIYRKANEKRLIAIESKFNEEKNKEIINEYCQKMGFEKYRNSNKVIIYNTVNLFGVNSNFKTSRIFLFENKKVYFTIIKENFRLNIPVLFSQIILKKEIEKLIKK